MASPIREGTEAMIVATLALLVPVAEPPAPIVVAQARDAIATARVEVRRGRPDQAQRQLRHVLASLRGELVAGDPRLRDWEGQIGNELIAAVRAEEQILAHERIEAELGDRAEAADSVPTVAGRDDELTRQFDKICAQAGFGGGGFGGGGGIGFGGGGGVGVGPGAVAFGAVPAALDLGPTLSVTPIVSADRRYVRLTMNPIFISNGSFQTYTVFGAVGGS